MAELVAEGLTVRAGERRILDGVSFRVRQGEVLAMVGSSGSGKSVTTRAVLDLLPFRPGRVAGTVAVVDGDGARPVRRGEDVGLIFQDSRASLDPCWTVGAQVRESARLGGGDEPPAAWLSRAGFDDPDRVAGLYPHELSGGMAQRVAIALALARRSRFLIADEPTTALDPTVQQAILTEVRRVADQGRGVLFITHDLRILPGLADRVVVMDGGRLVEEARDPWSFTGAGRTLVEATRKVAGGAW